MMIYSVLEAIRRIESISELNGKLAYDHFTEAKALPFAAYNYDFDTSGADDYNGIQWINFRLELYSENRDITLEQKILKAFIDVEIASDSNYIDTERMYMTAFNLRFFKKLT